MADLGHDWAFRDDTRIANGRGSVPSVSDAGAIMIDVEVLSLTGHASQAPGT